MWCCGSAFQRSEKIRTRRCTQQPPKPAADRPVNFGHSYCSPHPAAPAMADRDRSAAIARRLRSLASTLAFLVTVCLAHAGFAGFEVGNGVALTGGVACVTYTGNKSHTILLGPRVRLHLMEAQLTMANGQVKRHTMLFLGAHALRAPLPIEMVVLLGLVCLLALICGIAIALGFGLRRAQPCAPPSLRSGGQPHAPLRPTFKGEHGKRIWH
jgi:hypothetical protein